MHAPTIRIRDAAGPFARGFRAGYYRPFHRATGTKVLRRTGGIEPTGLIRQMVDSGEPDWDLAVISMSAQMNLTQDGADYLQPIALDTPELAAVPAAYRSAHFVGHDVYSMVVAYRADRFVGRPAPQGWADFWNVGRFPGSRALRKHPIDTFEQALLADGVDPAKLYPLDVDRALASLDRIYPFIDVWWSGAAEPSRLLASGRVDLCAMSTIRAQKVIDDGIAVGIGWQQNIRTCEGWVILKGTKQAELARQFLRFAMRPERQAIVARYVNSSPTLPGTAALIDPVRRAMMPDSHRSVAVESDAVFWSREKDSLLERFTAWFEQRRSQ